MASRSAIAALAALMMATAVNAVGQTNPPSLQAARVGSNRERRSAFRRKPNLYCMVPDQARLRISVFCKKTYGAPSMRRPPRNARSSMPSFMASVASCPSTPAAMRSTAAPATTLRAAMAGRRSKSFRNRTNDVSGSDVLTTPSRVLRLVGVFAPALSQVPGLYRVI